MRQYLLLATAVCLAAGCSDDDPTGPDNNITAQMRADIAQSSGDRVAEDVAAMSRTEASSSSTLFAFGGDLGEGCTIELGSFICVGSFGDVDGEARLTFQGAAGDDQTEYDASTTASVMINTESSGSTAHTGYTVDFEHETDLTVTGLVGDESARLWVGTGGSTITVATFAGSREYQIDLSTTYANVNVPATGADPRWPTSGTVTTVAEATVTGGPDDGKTATLTATVTFNGSAEVPLRVGDTDYLLNLDSHTVTAQAVN